MTKKAFILPFLQPEVSESIVNSLDLKELNINLDIELLGLIEDFNSSINFVNKKLSNSLIKRSLIKEKSVRLKDFNNLVIAYNYIFNNLSSISLTEYNIKKLHFLLAPKYNGSYRLVDVPIVGTLNNKNKTQVLLLKTAEPVNIDRLMNQLIYYMNILHQNNVQPLVVIAVFSALLLYIHPFKDANGRLVRLLITLLAWKVGYCILPIERVINKLRKEYYINLRKSQISLTKHHIYITPWCTFLLNCFKDSVSI